MAKNEIDNDKGISTVIADDIDFNGTLKFKDSLKIKGNFEGEINAEGHLIIGKTAKVKANIKAGKITIYGKVQGNISATDRIELLQGAELQGDIKSPDLVIESGCIFNGNSTMTPQKENK